MSVKPVRHFLTLIGFFIMSLSVAAPQARAVAQIQEVTSPGGIKAWLVENHTLPLLSITLAFKGGASQDAPEKSGTANLLSGLLDEGAGDLPALEFQQRQQELAMRMSFEVGRDAFHGSFQTLSANRAESLELLKLALTAPRFDAEPVERVKNQILAGLRRGEKDPNTIASRAFSEKLFGDHPYGRQTNGSLETVPAITSEDLKTFVANNFARDNLVIGVVGDITPEELGTVLDEVFGSLPEKATLTPVPDIEMQSQGQTTVIDVDIPQTVIRFALPGIDRQDPDYMAAYVLNHIFGGGTFSSRLFREVREERGLAYSVYSFLNPLDHAAVVVGGVATRNDAAKVSVDVIRDEIVKLRDTAPTEQELSEAKAFIKGSYQLRFDTSSKIARNLVGLQLEDLGIDYIERRDALIDAVTLEDLQRLAQRLLNPDNMAVVAVGRPEGLGQ